MARRGRTSHHVFFSVPRIGMGDCVPDEELLTCAAGADACEGRDEGGAAGEGKGEHEDT